MADKMTKKDWYAVIKEIVEASDYEDIVGAVDFIDHQVAQLDAKAAKASERAAAKKAEGDALRQMVFNVLTDEYQTADVITDLVDDDSITKAKVVARLTQLCNAGLAVKEQIKTEDGRRIMAYAVAGDATED